MDHPLYNMMVSDNPEIAASMRDIIAYLNKGSIKEALALCRTILVVEPANAPILCLSTLLENDLGQAVEISLATMDKVIALDPKNAYFYCYKGRILQQHKENDIEAALACLQHATTLDPDILDAYLGMGLIYERHKKYGEAIKAYEHAIKLNPSFNHTYNNLANIYNVSGNVQKAKEYYKKSISLIADPAIHSNYLMCLNYDRHQTPETLLAEHKEWNRLYAKPLAGAILPHTNEPNPQKKLKIGYVSADFKAHPVGNFLLPSMVFHNKEHSEIHCYSSVAKEDDMTGALKKYADHWHDVTLLTGEEITKKVREDGIDILVDLSGHTAGNRLGVFARKPAPVQVSWLGYFNTTGMDTMDYFISDAVHLPPGYEKGFTEEIIRLPDAYIAYAPYDITDKVPVRHWQDNGAITFGSFNNAAKLNEEVIALWAEILHKVPKSRLILKSDTLSVTECSVYFIEAFAAHGIAKERLELRGRSLLNELYAHYNEIDIALDPFPFNGGATTCDALWMGVPVITLAGQNAVSRQSATYLAHIGHPELITHSKEEYVALAVALSNSPERLAALHANLRKEMDNSPLCNAPRFAKNLEAAYRRMWHRWCAKVNPDTALHTDKIMLEADSYKKAGDLKLALASYQQVIKQQPEHSEALFQLAVLKNRLGEPMDQVLPYLDKAIALASDNDLYYYNKAVILQQHSYAERAILSYKKCLEINPGFMEAYLGLGRAYEQTAHVDEAIRIYEQMISLSPGHSAACNNLAALRRAQGKMGEALTLYKAALAKAPNAEVHSNYLFSLNYDLQQTPETLLAAHKEWNRLYAAPLAPYIQLHKNTAIPDRRLNIGYVSADFRRHPVGNFFLPVLQHHNKQQVSIYCYSATDKEDDLTGVIKSRADCWRPIRNLNDEAVAEQIRADAIDILVDLSGHTAGNRLLVFARKPAPIQMSWLGYFNTTGMDAMDYFISDNVHIPMELQQSFTEEILRLPDSYMVYAPYMGLAIPEKVISLSRPVTFGCFNNNAKINQEVARLWAEILHQVPGSRLILKNGAFEQVTVRADYLALFAACGISKEYLELRGRSILADALLQYNDVDIALDPFPFNGGATTCDALWMGVPVITLAGENAVSRQSASYLTQVGLTELIAHTKEEYVMLAVSLSNNRARLADLHVGLRKQMAASPLCDGARFAKNLEAAYRNIWQRWCREQENHLSKIALK
jgi:predicted O-linked N-acetylglucosamine transferase (SPINDLY family)